MPGLQHKVYHRILERYMKHTKPVNVFTMNSRIFQFQEFSFGDSGGQLSLIKLRGETCPSCFSLKKRAKNT